MIPWALQDQLDWEVLREAPDEVAAAVAARRPDLVAVRERAAAEVFAYLSGGRADGEAESGGGTVVDDESAGSAGRGQERRAAVVPEAPAFRHASAEDDQSDPAAGCDRKPA